MDKKMLRENTLTAIQQIQLSLFQEALVMAAWTWLRVRLDGTQISWGPCGCARHLEIPDFFPNAERAASPTSSDRSLSPCHFASCPILPLVIFHGCPWQFKPQIHDGRSWPPHQISWPSVPVPLYHFPQPNWPYVTSTDSCPAHSFAVDCMTALEQRASVCLHG